MNLCDDFLDTRSGGTHNANISLVHYIGKGNGNAADTSRPAIGAHNEQPLFACHIFKGAFLLDRDVVGKNKNMEAQLNGFFSLFINVCPGYGKKG